MAFNDAEILEDIAGASNGQVDRSYLWQDGWSVVRRTGRPEVMAAEVFAEKVRAQNRRDCRAYYARNREKILAQKKAKRLAL